MFQLEEVEPEELEVTQFLPPGPLEMVELVNRIQ
jgi:hypothetical protein